MAWLLMAAAFAGVWLAANHFWIFVLLPLVLLPLQLLVCRAVLAERGYQTWFAWFSLFMGPMGVLIVLGFPILPNMPAQPSSSLRRSEKAD
jgi:hypothetical protein